ncbi:MAG: diacylglycerol/polyprenol kinase family protein [Rhodothermia bacterium]
MSSEVWRKALHLLSLVIPVGLVYLDPGTALRILIPFTALAIIVEVLRARSESMRDLVEKIFGFMMRPEELPPVPAPVRFNGATWVLLTATFLVAIFPSTVAAAAISIGLIGDAAAALIGRRFGRTKIGNSNKTFEGSLAFVASTAPLIWIVPDLTVVAGAAGILAGAVTEVLDLPLNDNLTVPVVVAVVITLILP